MTYDLDAQVSSGLSLITTSVHVSLILDIVCLLYAYQFYCSSLLYPWLQLLYSRIYFLHG